MGEEVTDFNYDESGNLIDISHDGAWEAGKDILGIGVRALPGYIMPAVQTTGSLYHQEYYAGEAEDYARIEADLVEVTLEDGTTYSTLKTSDLSSLDPSAISYKFYAAGIGVALEESPDGERVELITESAAPN